MTRVAKLIIVDDREDYLMLWRSDHPAFPNDPDLPGGTVEPDETLLDAVVREVEEEVGVLVLHEIVEEVYAGDAYSAHGTHYSLYRAKLPARPEVELSWEHSSYKWLGRDEFLKTAHGAADTYMQMVYHETK